MNSKLHTKFKSLSHIKIDYELDLFQDCKESLMPIQYFLHFPPGTNQSKPNSNQLYSAQRRRNTRNFSTFERHQDWVDKRDLKVSRIKEERDLVNMKECTFNPILNSKPFARTKSQTKSIDFLMPKTFSRLDTDEFKQKVFCTKQYMSISPYSVNIAYQAGCSKFK